MSAFSAILERFDAPDFGAGDDARTQQLKAAAYSAGYAAGEAAAAAQAKSDADLLVHLKAALDGALAGMPGELNAQLAAALRAVIQKTLPAIAEKGFAEEFAASVIKHVDFSKGVRLSVRAAPGRMNTLETAFATFKNRVSISFEEDAALPDDAVVAQWKDSGFEFNAQAAIDEIVKALELCISQSTNRKAS